MPDPDDDMMSDEAAWRRRGGRAGRPTWPPGRRPHLVVEDLFPRRPDRGGGTGGTARRRPPRAAPLASRGQSRIADGRRPRRRDPARRLVLPRLRGLRGAGHRGERPGGGPDARLERAQRQLPRVLPVRPPGLPPPSRQPVVAPCQRPGVPELGVARVLRGRPGAVAGGHERPRGVGPAHGRDHDHLRDQPRDPARRPRRQPLPPRGTRLSLASYYYSHERQPGWCASPSSAGPAGPRTRGEWGSPNPATSPSLSCSRSTTASRPCDEPSTSSAGGSGNRPERFEPAVLDPVRWERLVYGVRGPGEQ